MSRPESHVYSVLLVEILVIFFGRIERTAARFFVTTICDVRWLARLPKLPFVFLCFLLNDEDDWSVSTVHRLHPRASVGSATKFFISYFWVERFARPVCPIVPPYLPPCIQFSLCTCISEMTARFLVGCRQLCAQKQPPSMLQFLYQCVFLYTLVRCNNIFFM